VTRDEHIACHKILHRSFDALLADFLFFNPDKGIDGTTAHDLIQWSHAQTLDPSTPQDFTYSQTPDDVINTAEACRRTLAHFESIRAEEGDPLREIQDRYHGPIREMLRGAIARAEGRHQTGG
jgi:hypothetical protein